jgi:hypothetical protein
LGNADAMSCIDQPYFGVSFGGKHANLCVGDTNESYKLAAVQ